MPTPGERLRSGHRGVGHGRFEVSEAALVPRGAAEFPSRSSRRTEHDRLGHRFGMFGAERLLNPLDEAMSLEQPRLSACDTRPLFEGSPRIRQGGAPRRERMFAQSEAGELEQVRHERFGRNRRRRRRRRRRRARASGRRQAERGGEQGGQRASHRSSLRATGDGARPSVAPPGRARGPIDPRSATRKAAVSSDIRATVVPRAAKSSVRFFVFVGAVVRGWGQSNLHPQRRPPGRQKEHQQHEA